MSDRRRRSLGLRSLIGGQTSRPPGTRAVVLVDDLRVRVLTEDGELIRELTLDPMRD